MSGTTLSRLHLFRSALGRVEIKAEFQWPATVGTYNRVSHRVINDRGVVVLAANVASSLDYWRAKFFATMLEFSTDALSTPNNRIRTTKVSR